MAAPSVMSTLIRIPTPVPAMNTVSSASTGRPSTVRRISRMECSRGGRFISLLQQEG